MEGAFNLYTSLLLFVIYLTFISLGLPDSLLGAAWPLIYPSFAVPVSYAGHLSMLISLGTIIASFQSEHLTRILGTVKITTISIGLTALGLLAFAFSRNFYHLILATIPYGLGAGSIDAALNNYVALHYKSAHMSWLHCMWGVGASIGPCILGMALANKQSWQSGYRIIAYIQIALAVIVAISTRLWHKQAELTANLVSASNSNTSQQADLQTAKQATNTNQANNSVQAKDATQAESSPKQQANTKLLRLRDVWQLRGAKATLLTFFCYSAMEHCTGLWASSYLVLKLGLGANLAAAYASRFFLGITIGRFISGFISFKLDDKQLIRLGQSIVTLGLLMLMFANSAILALIALTIVGLGCAPIYPAIIHATPSHFGKERSQALIGMQMGCAYIGSCLMPQVFGFLSKALTIGFYPYFLAIFLVIMLIAHEALNKQLN